MTWAHGLIHIWGQTALGLGLGRAEVAGYPRSASCPDSDLEIWEDWHDLHRCHSGLAVMLGDLGVGGQGQGEEEDVELWGCTPACLPRPARPGPSFTDFWASSKVFSMAVIWLSLSL